ncbi:dihydroorotate dehydrogenase [Candidatus Peregrinibacteria bacterium]|nr:dihydroorotate dehydrogenase [Candidatus Peregrinibacteria bacterium]
MDTSVLFCGVKFSNPTVLASGILGVTASSLINVARHGAGGVTTKSVWYKEHAGHRNPVIVVGDHYMLNAVGLPDAGIEKTRVELPKLLKESPSPVIVSIVERSIADFEKIAEEVAKLKPPLIEVNISCPNVDDEFGKPFSCSTVEAGKVTRAVKKRVGKIPIIVKLSPNVTNIVEIARSVAHNGADAICAINTLGPGLMIDIEMRASVLSNGVGGISGPAIKPLAVRCVYDIHRATGLPIIGTGGVTTGRDAVEMMMAGATLVGVGTAVHYRGIDVFKKIIQEIEDWCKKNNVKMVKNLVGILDSRSMKNVKLVS